MTAGLLLASCEKTTDDGIQLSDPIAPVLINPDGNGEYILTKASENNPFETFIWSAADYGQPIVSNYTLQLDSADRDFSNGIEMKESTTSLSQNITVGDFNQRLLDLGFTPKIPGVVQVRVNAVNNNTSISSITSNIVDLKVTTFDATKIYPKLYIPGSYQAAGGYGNDWDPSNEKSVIWSVEENGKFEGYINFGVADASWKFSDVPSWTGGDWGDGNSDGLLDKDGNISMITEAGYYKLNVDWSADPKPWKFMKTDWGLIGSSTPGGWDSDTDMSFDMDNLNLTVTVDLIVGEIKFRANDAWDLSYGMSKPGIIGGTNDNIPIESAGNYTIVLDLSKAVYTYTITKN